MIERGVAHHGSMPCSALLQLDGQWPLFDQMCYDFIAVWCTTFLLSNSNVSRKCNWQVAWNGALKITPLPCWIGRPRTRNKEKTRRLTLHNTVLSSLYWLNENRHLLAIRSYSLCLIVALMSLTFKSALVQVKPRVLRKWLEQWPTFQKKGNQPTSAVTCVCLDWRCTWVDFIVTGWLVVG